MQKTEQWREKQNTKDKTKPTKQKPSHQCIKLHIRRGDWKTKLDIGRPLNLDLLWTPTLNLVYCNTHSEGPEGLKEGRDHGNIPQLNQRQILMVTLVISL